MSVTIKNLRAGECLFREGDASDFIYIINQGELQVLKFFSGLEKEIARLTERQLVGELALIDRSPRSASVVALTDCILMEIPLEFVEKYFASQPSWSRAVVESLISRLKATNEKLAQAI